MKNPLARLFPTSDVENPLTGKPMNREHAEYVGQLKEVRRNAKKAARSGNPAKRGPAVKVLAQVGPMIGQTYGQDAVVTLQREVGAR